MTSVRSLLDLLPHDALVRLCTLRSLPARSDEARRVRLARSYHGETMSLLDELRQPDLLRLIGRDFVADSGRTYRLKGASRYDVDGLRAICRSVFVENRLTPSFEAVSKEEPANEGSAAQKIPQADNLSRVAQMVALLSGSINSHKKLAKKLSISDRQVLYYTQAANFLGLIKPEDDFYSVTNEGKKIIDAKPEKKLSLLIELFLKTPFVKDSLGPSAAKSEVGEAELAKVIKKRGYSAETAKRRAQTLLSWFRQADADFTQSIREGRFISNNKNSTK